MWSKRKIVKRNTVSREIDAKRWGCQEKETSMDSDGTTKTCVGFQAFQLSKRRSVRQPPQCVPHRYSLRSQGAVYKILGRVPCLIEKKTVYSFHHIVWILTCSTVPGDERITWIVGLLILLLHAEVVAQQPWAEHSILVRSLELMHSWVQPLHRPYCLAKWDRTGLVSTKSTVWLGVVPPGVPGYHREETGPSTWHMRTFSKSEHRYCRKGFKQYMQT